MYQNGYNTNQNKMKNTCPFCIVFQVLKVCLIKMCKIEPPDLPFLVSLISFCISRYHFSQIFRTSVIIICKKDFCHKLSILTDSLKAKGTKRFVEIVFCMKAIW